MSGGSTHMQDGDRPRAPSIRDVARHAGVSYQTVSRVLNSHPQIRPETADRVRVAIGELGYRPNRAARALVTRRSRTIGVLFSARALYGPFGSFLAIVDAARARGYAVTTTPNASDEPDDIVTDLEALLTHGVEGIIAISPQDRAREAVRTSGAAVPLITLQGGSEEVGDFGFDQREGARVAVRHLAGLGHRRILHLRGPHGWAEAEDRYRGYREEVEALGLVPLVAESPEWTADSGFAVGERALAELMPTAVFAANDETAVGVLAAARRLGLEVPADLSVVGFDDVPMARYLGPGLTTLRQDFDELGRRAIALLLDRIEGESARSPSRIVPDLVVRGSTAEVTVRERGPAPPWPIGDGRPYDSVRGVNVSLP